MLLLKINVSIHHMLLFISPRRGRNGGKESFNTSHVTLYHGEASVAYTLFRRFNTSHVTLYRQRCHRQGQRIHVSIHHMLLFIYPPNEHTHPYIRFQYITCYSLSTTNYGFLKPEDEFQYITCYSLSSEATLHLLKVACFNTSHVTLYHYRKHHSRYRHHSFNTSHVTLYPDVLSAFSDASCFNTSHVTLYLIYHCEYL